MIRLLACICCSIPFIGCAGTNASMLSPAPDHPASPQAEEAALSFSTGTLALGEGAPPAPSADPSGDASHVHGEHGGVTRPPASTGTPGDDSHVKPVFVCPMHPDVVSDHAGKCPRCGMTLREKKAEGSSDHPHHD